MANDKYNMTGGVGSWLYMAPEVVRRLGCSDEMGSIIGLPHDAWPIPPFSGLSLKRLHKSVVGSKSIKHAT